ncbi:electron transfer flavoprotein-ubiquinone oxidoreductase [Pokkaliibacter sp. CJK22405]|uniref:electron transfer flavoprotein-ubiquinone oxidoreductase n=1 Tax=Pokkaliibacter sp. CJK22405 TaxID=3384615 RepID=UPI0039847F4E
MEREVLTVDVLIVGAGPAGLGAACRLKQLRPEPEFSVCVVEKGSEIGAHTLSGAILDPKALNELFPDWQSRQPPAFTPVTQDEMHWFRSDSASTSLPHWLIPKPMHNEGNLLISLGIWVRWLAEQAEALGVEVFPGFPAHALILEDDQVRGITTGDFGLDHSGQPKSSFTPGMEIRATATLLAEGARGHLGQEVIRTFSLDQNTSPQHYALGIKELWEIPESQHQPGRVLHSAGWPLEEHDASGGGFMYHVNDRQVVVGLITDLNYANPYLNPYEEFQRFKHHPQISKSLSGGQRLCYGARAIAKGGWNSLPRLTFPGGLLIGCDAGTLNFAKIKGIHTAMKSGMVAAETLHRQLSDTNAALDSTPSFDDDFKASWAGQELYQARNFGPALHKLGTWFGGAFNWLDQRLNGKLPFTIKDSTADHLTLRDKQEFSAITYPKPDGGLSFDKLSSVYLSNTNHEEDQPCHLQLHNPDLPLGQHWVDFDEPAQRYCPAGVYEITESAEGRHFQINAQNCLHCKTCDIKDPSQNIRWVTPEGGGGPNYPSM